MVSKAERTQPIAFWDMPEEEFMAKTKAAAMATLEGRATLLQTLSRCFCKDQTQSKYAVVKDTEFIGVLAVAMEENKQSWVLEPPKWIVDAVDSIYYNMQWDIPLAQTRRLMEITKDYLAEQETISSITLLHRIVTPVGNKKMVMADPDVYSLLKRVIKEGKYNFNAVRCLQAAVLNSPEWQSKVLSDTEFILQLVEASTDEAWAFLSIVAQHDDAKVLFPPEVMEKAKMLDKEHCINICAILCSEAEAMTLKLNSTYVQNRVQRLEELLHIKHDQGRVFPNSLLSLVLPFVNLSIADAAKDPLGKQLVGPLLRVLAITRDKPLVSKIDRSLERSKQEAARALWNLAFFEGNRKRIEDEGGELILSPLVHSKDAKLACNVSGILYMISQKHVAPPVAQPPSVKGHVMISYNWSNQRTILRIANSLKEQGYRIWLDVEKMGGSTLEAMADAIERSDLVLMCMSQKYKDSPNCRLEGEYCINRKVDFIPVIMQKDYFPDGWLGIALGSKFWHDFSSEENWEVKMSALVKAIGNNGKGDSCKPPTANGACTANPVENWLPQDIKTWMEKNCIGQHYDKLIENGIGGRALLELKALLLSNNNNLLTFLREGLGTCKMGDVLDITAALRKL